MLVSGGGRSGTTLLMQLLGTSPLVAFDRIPPYEHRYLTFVLRSALLSRPQPLPDGWNQAAMAAARAPMMGPIPWRKAAIARAGDRPLWVDLFLASWTEISRRAIAHEEARTGTTPTHYAEKAPPWVSGRLDDVLDHDELIPIRDPRDVFVSVLQFTERRGRGGFGIREGEDPVTFATRFVGGQRRRLTAAIEAEREGTATVVRYERMVQDLGAEAARLGDLLGLPFDPDAVLAARPEFRDHMTSPDPESSIGRWRDELPPEVAAPFEDLADELAALGYAA